ncbi:MAG: beta-N-acetylhexosaminidase [Candidatus Latescibacterota bacterium]|nr:beta-N-acetylhexosaminidase [Candidatus Latescibacterota bacterium]
MHPALKNLIPRPALVEESGAGGYSLDTATRVRAEDGALAVAGELARFLAPICGTGEPEGLGERGGVRLRIDDQAIRLGDEGYCLEVNADDVQIRAAKQAGLFYGVQTLKQMLPVELEAGAAASAGELPLVRITDRPRFSWRGAHLDVARHFFPVDFVKRYIDLLARHKQNIFHWHLTEDQGWRIEIEEYPALTEVGAWRRREDGERYGGHYTASEVTDVVRYAAERQVTVVPEIEMPGHALAALAAYPQFSCAGGPFEVTSEWGIFDDVYCAGNDDAITMLEAVLERVLELFPSTFVHVGGDECPKTRWRQCERCQARIRAQGLDGEDELQSWFVGHFDRFLSERGRRLLGWDEILEGGLADGAAVMSWRGTEGGIAAVRAGHDVVMSPQSHVYLDYKHYENDDAGRLGVTSLEKCYAFDPLPAEVSDVEAKRVLGVQANVWSEGMVTDSQVEALAWPRMCAVAEIGWTPQSDRVFGDFCNRLRGHGRRLSALGVGYYRDPTVWSA